MYYRGSAAAVVVYDITSEVSKGCVCVLVVVRTVKMVKFGDFEMVLCGALSRELCTGYSLSLHCLLVHLGGTCY